MEKLVLQAKVRTVETPVKPLRASGVVPAVVYGHNIKNVHLSVSANEFEKVLRKAGESTIITLDIEGAGQHNVLIHDVQKHMVKSQPIHVDFLEVSMTEKLETAVALEYEGESAAVKALGGTLVKVLSEITIECLPADLPHNLVVDISSMATFEDTIAVKDIALPKGVSLVTDPEETVAKVQPPRDLEAELSAPVEEDVTKVEGVVKAEAPAEDAKAE